MPKGLILNVDTTKSEFQNPMVELRQGDGNYQSLYVTVTDNGDPFELTGWTVSFMGTTAGSHKIIDANVVLDSTVVGAFTYTPTKSWGQDEGEFKNAYFKFVNSDETASGASFRVNVLNAVDLTDEEAQDYISVVDAMIDQVKTDMDSKLADTQTTLSNTQSQATTVQSNVDDLNNNVNELKEQNNNIKTSDNTWSGENSFSKPIIGPMNVRQVPSGTQTIKDLIDNFISEVSNGVFANVSYMSYNNPFSDSPFTSGYLYIKIATRGQRTYVEVFDENNNVAFTNYVSGAFITWRLYASAASVVNNTGNETIAGNKTFTGSTTFSSIINGSINGNAATATKATAADSATTANDPNAVKLSGNQTISGDNTFSGATNIVNLSVNGNNYGYSSASGVTWTNYNSGTINIEKINGVVYVSSNNLNVTKPAQFQLPSGFIPKTAQDFSVGGLNTSGTTASGYGHVTSTGLFVIDSMGFATGAARAFVDVSFIAQ